MTPLTQQLEDKKKGCDIDIGGVPCGEFIAHTEDEDGREWGKTYYCKHCKEIIAILEQAIAEIKNIQSQQNGKGDDALRQQTTSELSEGTKASIPSYKGATCKPETQSADISNLLQKQRQEILDEIGYKIFSEDEQKSNNVWYKKGWDDNASRINKELQQLNQPKTEEWGKIK